MQLSRTGTVGKNDKGRRTDGRLGQVLDLGAVFPSQGFDEAVQFAGTNSMRGSLKTLADQGEKRRSALPFQGRYENYRGIIQEFESFLNLIQEFPPVAL